MKTAFLINCHKNMKQVARLAHRLHSQDNHIFIHVDRKVSHEDYTALFSLTGDLEHCHISSTRIDGKLDNRSLVDITMVLVSDAKRIAREKSIHYAYYSNMSGQDYLIKPLELIREKLETNYPDIYMRYRSTSDASLVEKMFDRTRALIKYRDWVLQRKNKMVRKALQGLGIVLRKVAKLFGRTSIQRMSKKGWKAYQGSAWWVFPDSVIDGIEKEYYGQTEFAGILLDETTTPEETFFQSMVMHLFFSDCGENNPKYKIQKRMTYVDFGSVSNRPQTCHPYILTLNDYERLSGSECWFARKFDDTVDPDILDKIDATLL